VRAREAIVGLIPDTLAGPMRRLYYGATDWVDFMLLRPVQVALGRRDPLTPPRRLIAAVGGGDFEKVGRELLDLFVELGGLRPSDRILDVGCGSGRMAAALTKFLTSGSYEGFDIVHDTVRWCQRIISPSFPAFRFSRVDIYNELYNPCGKISAEEFRFPHDDRAFDFVFLTSIFTHMLPGGVENYAREVARVLDRGGRCFATFFVLNDESLSLIEHAPPELNFRHVGDGYRYNNARRPELAVAYPEKFVRELFARHGLEIATIHYGSWCGRTSYKCYQDVVVATRAT
jgi:SAM-dependent methyltransferase